MAEEWIEQYRRDGCVLLERLLPAEIIDAYVEACDRLLNARGMTARADRSGDPNMPLHEALIEVRVDNPEFRPLHLHAGVRQRVAALLDDDDPILVSSLTNIWEKGREPHSDTVMLFRDPPDKVCRTWCALEDIDPECGAFYVISGTHRSVRPLLYDDVLRTSPEILDLLHTYDAGAEVSRHDNRFIWGKVCEATTARVAGMPRQAFAINKGDVVFFDPNAIHGTMPATNPALMRKAIIAEWHAREVRSYPASAYFGSQLDCRGPHSGKLTADAAISCPLGRYVPRSA